MWLQYGTKFVSQLQARKRIFGAQKRVFDGKTIFAQEAAEPAKTRTTWVGGGIQTRTARR